MNRTITMALTMALMTGCAMELKGSGVSRSELRTPDGYDPAPYDYVVFTPGADRGDPCEGMHPPAPPARR